MTIYGFCILNLYCGFKIFTPTYYKENPKQFPANKIILSSTKSIKNYLK